MATVFQEMVHAIVREPAYVSKLSELCHVFLKDTYAVEVDRDALDAVVRDAILHVSRSEGADSLTLPDLNKRVLVLVKKAVLQGPAPQGPAPSAPPANTDEQDLGGFMVRLQHLETSRAVLPPPPPCPPQPPQPPSTAVAPLQNVSAPPPVPPTVFVSAPPRTGVPIVVDAAARPWAYSPDRSSWVWSGPIPPTLDKSRLRVCALRLPRTARHASPFVCLHIRAAGGQTSWCPMVPDASEAGLGLGWDTWRPCSEALGALPALACPWTLSLVGADGTELDALGRDGAVVAAAEGHVLRTQEPFSALPDEVLLLVTPGGERHRAVVVRAARNTLEVDVDCAPNTLVAASVLNLHRQPCVVIEAFAKVT